MDERLQYVTYFLFYFYYVFLQCTGLLKQGFHIIGLCHTVPIHFFHLLHISFVYDLLSNECSVFFDMIMIVAGQTVLMLVA